MRTSIEAKKIEPTSKFVFNSFSWFSRVHAFISDATRPNERIIIRENNNRSEHPVPWPHVPNYFSKRLKSIYPSSLLNSHKSNENNHYKPHRVPVTAQKTLSSEKNVETTSSLLDTPHNHRDCNVYAGYELKCEQYVCDKRSNGDNPRCVGLLTRLEC